MNLQQYQVRESGSLRTLVLRLADAAAVTAGLLAAASFRAPLEATAGYTAALVAIVTMLLVAEAFGLYRAWRGAGIENELGCALASWAASAPIVVVVGHFLTIAPLIPRTTAGLWFLFTALLVVGGRVALRVLLAELRRRGFNSRRYAVVGANELGLQLVRNIEQSPHLGLRLAGFFDDRPESRATAIPPELGARGGDIARLVEMARAGEVSLIYIALPMRAEQRVRRILERLADSTATVYLAPDFFVYELLHARWTTIGGMPVVGVFEHPFYGVDGGVKRLLDIGLSAALLVALAVPMAIVAAMIKLTSRGPVFFRQQRYGMDGRVIRVWKFRSMTVCEDGSRVTQAQKGDARVTPLGGVLRKTSIDELPQLFNVLAGEMSLVGPRPHAAAHNEQYRKLIQGYMLRHKVKPGITGLAQVNGWRGETDTLYKMQKRVEFDHQYIRDWSIWLDVKILFRTIFTVLKRENAY
jgi:putative colanic acid biosynthesis UDP-glucose lipid carrier transferase